MTWATHCTWAYSPLRGCCDGCGRAAICVLMLRICTPSQGPGEHLLLARVKGYIM